MKSPEMNLFSKWHDTEVYMNDAGIRIIIDLVESQVSKLPHYFVAVKPEGKKMKTVATRCTYEKAMQIAREYYFQ